MNAQTLENERYEAVVLPPESQSVTSDFVRSGAAATIWEDPRWRKYVERTNLHEVRYLDIHCGGRAIARAPLLITQASGGLLFYDPPRLIGTAGSMAEPDLLDPDDQRRWDEWTTALPDATQYPSLALGTFGSHHGVVHAPDRTVAQRRSVMTALPSMLRQATRDLQCRSVALLYLDHTDAAFVDDAASRAGYSSVLLGADGVFELHAASWDAYITDLTKRRRKRLKTELALYEAAGYRTTVTEGAHAIDEDIVALQVAHRSKYGLPGGDERVRSDFNALREEIGDSCVVLSAERGGRKEGFMLYLRAGTSLFARTTGFLPSARNCYFALGYHETARWALANGIRHIHYGLAAYEAKVARGCRLEPRWGWFCFDGAKSQVYRDVLTLQSQSIHRRLAKVGARTPARPSDSHPELELKGQQ